jgi:hypothetical protein
MSASILLESHFRFELLSSSSAMSWWKIMSGISSVELAFLYDSLSTAVLTSSNEIYQVFSSLVLLRFLRYSSS